MLLERSRTLSPTNPVTNSGKAPVNLFCPRSRNPRLLQLALGNAGPGKDPERELLCSFSETRPSQRFHIEVGTVPVSKLSDKSTSFREEL